MNNVLVTGGGGYIGSALVPELLDRGFYVTVLDTFAHGENSLAAHCWREMLQVVRGDVRDLATVRALMRDAGVIVPLAAVVGAPACAERPIEAQSVNVVAQIAMFGACSPSQLIIMPTTNSAYGKGGAEPLDESAELRPLSDYARQKVAVERALMENGRAISLRLATVFGMSPRMRLDLLVNDFTYRAVRDRALALYEPHARRNYVHVRDVASAFCHAIENASKMAGGIYNVGDTEANCTKRELCALIAKEVPGFSWAEIDAGEDPDQRDYLVSNAKIEAAGWRPAHTLRDGVRELVKGFAAMGVPRHRNA